MSDRAVIHVFTDVPVEIIWINRKGGVQRRDSLVYAPVHEPAPQPTTVHAAARTKLREWLAEDAALSAAPAEHEAVLVLEEVRAAIQSGRDFVATTPRDALGFADSVLAHIDAKLAALRDHSFGCQLMHHEFKPSEGER